ALPLSYAGAGPRGAVEGGRRGHGGEGYITVGSGLGVARAHRVRGLPTSGARRGILGTWPSSHRRLSAQRWWATCRFDWATVRSPASTCASSTCAGTSADPATGGAPTTPATSGE